MVCIVAPPEVNAAEETQIPSREDNGGNCLFLLTSRQVSCFAQDFLEINSDGLGMSRAVKFSMYYLGNVVWDLQFHMFIHPPMDRVRDSELER